jgi:mannose-6-phosphate isomerase-like protein (cupin superfamily)
MDKVNLAEKLSLFSDLWSPKIVGELNGQQVKLAKLQGDIVPHRHAEEDELFLVLRGRLVLEMPDGQVELSEGELFIVPRGVEHHPVAEEETHVLLFEPASTRHTGEHRTERTAEKQDWI